MSGDGLDDRSGTEPLVAADTRRSEGAALVWPALSVSWLVSGAGAADTAAPDDGWAPLELRPAARLGAAPEAVLGTGARAAADGALGASASAEAGPAGDGAAANGWTCCYGVGA